MRFGLSIQRHALPIVRIIWTVRQQDPTFTAAPCHPTISQLLEDVNDIVQLESGEWGLEDYAVEVNGYECLHFQTIKSVLKEDDNVLIRALSSDDLHMRKLSGRHQITSDGRHLVDGVAFGRRYLRKAARPPFRIPARKRRKLELDQEQYIEDDTVQLLESPPAQSFQNEVPPVENDVETRSNEPRHLQLLPLHETVADELEPSDSSDDPDYSANSSSSDEELEGEETSDVSDDQEASRATSSKHDDLESTKLLPRRRQRSETSSSPRYPTRKRRLEFSDNLSNEIAMSSPRDKNSPTFLIDSSHSFREVAEQDERQQDDSRTEHAPGRDISLAVASRSYGNLRAHGSQAKPATSSSSPTSMSARSASSSRQETESYFTSTSTAESDSSSDVSTSSSKQTSIHSLAAVPVKASAPKQQHVPSAPGEGLPRTQRNNKRLKKKRLLKRLKSDGLLEPDASFVELAAYQAREKRCPTENASQPDRVTEMLEARRQELMRGIPPVDNVPDGISASHAHDAPQTDEASHERNFPTDTSPRKSLLPSKADSQMRNRLDIESSRRMVFGSLGLRAPQTATEEQVLREKLQNDTTRDFPEEGSERGISATEALEVKEGQAMDHSETESWKDKIELSAVECLLPGRTLSQPPFPFVQHWEKNAMVKFTQPSYVIDRRPVDVAAAAAAAAASFSSSSSSSSSSSQLNDSRSVNGIQGLNWVSTDEDACNQLSQELCELAARESVTKESSPDLPVATNPDNFEALRAEDIVAGNIITFKQLDLSKDTGWQPQISPYRTAKIIEIFDCSNFKAALAKRDRPRAASAESPSGQERIFEAFEMPIEDSWESVDPAIVELQLENLIEPKLVERFVINEDSSSERNGNHAATDDIESGLGQAVSQVEDSLPAERDRENQLDLSTPRQQEIRKIIKDAGFDSVLHPELLTPAHIAEEGSPVPATVDETHKAASRRSQHSSNQLPPGLDGSDEGAVDAYLYSPRYTPWESSADPAGQDLWETSDAFIQEDNVRRTERSSSVLANSRQADVNYPRLSQLAIDESINTEAGGGTLVADVLRARSMSERNQQHDAADCSQSNGFVDAENGPHFTTDHSRLESLKSTIPPSDDPGLAPRRPASSRGSSTSPRTRASHGSDESDLPSLSEITSSARSREVPASVEAEFPHRSQGQERRNDVDDADELADHGPVDEQDSEFVRPRQQPSPEEQQQQNGYAIPPGSQAIDLTQCSSDPASPSSALTPPSQQLRPLRQSRARANNSKGATRASRGDSVPGGSQAGPGEKRKKKGRAGSGGR